MSKAPASKNIAPTLVQNYINKNHVGSQYDEFLKNNDGWDRLKELSNTTFQDFTFSPRQLSDFFSKGGIFSFVPDEEKGKTQAAILTLESTMAELLPRWEKLRSQHESRSGAVTADDNYDLIVTLGQEYINLSDHYSGLSNSIVDYLYGVMQTTEANISRAQALANQAKEEAAPAEQTAESATQGDATPAPASN